MQAEPEKRPNTIPWPPILLAAAVIGAIALDRLVVSSPPIPFAATLAGQAVGWALMGLGFALFYWARTVFKRAGTTILPHRAPSALVTTGPFAYSRNPIYLGDAMLLAGIGIVLNMLGFLIAVPLFMFAVSRLAIRREEQFMLDRFGDEWVDYADRVRRWL